MGSSLFLDFIVHANFVRVGPFIKWVTYNFGLGNGLQFKFGMWPILTSENKFMSRLCPFFLEFFSCVSLYVTLHPICSRDLGGNNFYVVSAMHS